MIPTEANTKKLAKLRIQGFGSNRSQHNDIIFPQEYQINENPKKVQGKLDEKSTTAVIETKEAPCPTEMSKSLVEYSFPRNNIPVLTNLASNREHINITECVQADLQQLTGKVGGTTLTEVEELFEMADQSFPTIFSWQDESDEELKEGDSYEDLSSLIEEEPPQQVYSLLAISLLEGANAEDLCLYCSALPKVAIYQTSICKTA